MTCEDVKKLIGQGMVDCCSSCHYDDDELGVSMLETKVSGEIIEVCCSVYRALPDRIL